MLDKWAQVGSAFRHRNYRLFWCGQLISMMGTWMQNMAQGWLVLELTNSAFLLGVLVTVQFLPVTLLTLFAGVVADHVPKRKVLIITQSVMLTLAAVLGTLVYFQAVRYWHVLVLAAVLGLANTFDMPTRQSFVVEMVGQEDLTNAIALNSSVFNVGRVIGPTLAGLVIGRVGIAVCFMLNAVSFIPVIAGLLMMNLPEKKWGFSMDIHLKEEVKEGLQYIRGNAVVLFSMMLLALLNVMTMNFNVVIPVLARDTMQLGAEGFGYLMSGLGVGAFCGSLFMAAASKEGPRRRVLLAGAAGLCIFQIAVSISRSLVLSMLLLGLTGFFMLIFTASVNSTIQMNTPDYLRGRVMSVYVLIFGGITPIGGFISGTATDLWGAPVVMAMGAAIGLIGLVIITGKED